MPLQQGVLTGIRHGAETLPDRLNRWYRRLLLPRRAALTGVDIGRREIRVVRAKMTGATPEVVSIGCFPTPPDVFADGMCVEKLAVTLKQAVQTTGTEIEDVVTAIGGDKVIIRHIRMPVMPEKEVESAIRWEAERHIPVPLEELVLRHVTLGEVATDEVKQLNIMLVAAPIKTVHEYYTLFQQAGLRLVAIDLQALALWRVFAGSHKAPPAGTVGIVNIGSAVSQFVVLRDGKLELTRTITIGGNAVTEALARTCGVDFNVAQRMKEEEGDAAAVIGEVAIASEPGGVQLNFAVQEGLGEIVRGIRQSLSWCRTQNRERSVERIILCGGGAKLKGLPAFLTEELELPVDLGLPGVRVHTANPEEEYEPSLAVAIGLALREVVG
ncbi:MAG: type IV pilus assembly protein PilM [Bacillota bacterium]